MKIAIIGYGVVGSGVYEILKENAKGIEKRCGQSIGVKYVLDIRDFPDHSEKEIFVKDFNIVLNDPQVEAVVETMGGIRFAYDYTKAALEKGKSVVTSNKELVAMHGHEFFKIAKENNCRYLYEASVGGGIPVIRPMAHCLAANEIESVAGIINGTTNYILTKMFKENHTFADALSEAQRLGYAEKDPSADVDGIDVCRKIAILASLCLGKRVDAALIPTKGIRDITAQDVKAASLLGCSIKLLGVCEFKDGKAEIFVEPMLVPDSNPLACIEDVFNGVLVKGNMVDDVMLYGRGAGKLPTASAVVADVMDIAKNAAYTPEFSWEETGEGLIADYDKTESRFLVRLENESIEKAKAALGGCEREIDGGIVTGVISERKLNAALTGINGVISKMRIFR